MSSIYYGKDMDKCRIRLKRYCVTFPLFTCFMKCENVCPALIIMIVIGITNSSKPKAYFIFLFPFTSTTILMFYYTM